MPHIKVSRFTASFHCCVSFSCDFGVGMSLPNQQGWGQQMPNQPPRQVAPGGYAPGGPGQPGPNMRPLQQPYPSPGMAKQPGPAGAIPLNRMPGPSTPSSINFNVSGAQPKQQGHPQMVRCRSKAALFFFPSSAAPRSFCTPSPN